MSPRISALALLLAAAVACSDHAAPAPEGDDAPSMEVQPAPLGESIYALHIDLLDQDGARVPLDAFRGHPVIIAMFYGTCPVACPMLTSDIKAIDARLSPAERADVRVLLVSFDPARDTPEALRALREKHRVDPARWRFAAAAEGDARALSAVLGVGYRRLPDGEFSHSAKITLLDRKGAPIAESEGLGQPADGIVAGVRAVVARR